MVVFATSTVFMQEYYNIATVKWSLCMYINNSTSIKVPQLKLAKHQILLCLRKYIVDLKQNMFTLTEAPDLASFIASRHICIN